MKALSLVVLFLAIALLVADAASVAYGWTGKTTRYELVGFEPCFIREHRQGVVIHVSRDLPERYHHSALGYEAIERLNEQSGLH